MKIIHIGLPKTGTTTLQRLVFPKLVEMGVLGSFNPPELFSELPALLNENLPGPQVERLRALLDQSPDPCLVSSEALVRWNPLHWEKACERNARVFGQHAVILLTLRDPLSYMRSIYQQMVHEGQIVAPEEFFGEGADSTFCCDAFSYEKLVSFYSAHFDKVVVAGLPAIFSLEFLNSILPVDDDKRRIILRGLETIPAENVAYSNLAMELTFMREKLLGGFCKKADAKPEIHSPTRTRPLRPFSQLPWNEKICHFPHRALRSMAIHLRWRNLMQGVVNRSLPYKKFELPKDICRGPHFHANIAFYESVVASDKGIRIF